MGNQVDCCYNARWSYQCVFPCIRFCTYTGRRVWYNYDGMEKVQPLVHLYQPQPAPIHSFPDNLHGINDDADIAAELKSGRYPLEHRGYILITFLQYRATRTGWNKNRVD